MGLLFLHCLLLLCSGAVGLEEADRRTATMANGKGFLILGNIFGAVRVALDFIPIVAVF